MLREFNIKFTINKSIYVTTVVRTSGINRFVQLFELFEFNRRKDISYVDYYYLSGDNKQR